MDRVKVINEEVPPEEVIANFENFYQLEELPSMLIQVGAGWYPLFGCLTYNFGLGTFTHTKS